MRILFDLNAAFAEIFIGGGQLIQIERGPQGRPAAAIVRNDAATCYQLCDMKAGEDVGIFATEAEARAELVRLGLTDWMLWSGRLDAKGRFKADELIDGHDPLLAC